MAQMSNKDAVERIVAIEAAVMEHFDRIRQVHFPQLNEQEFFKLQNNKTGQTVQQEADLMFMQKIRGAGLEPYLEVYYAAMGDPDNVSEMPQTASTNKPESGNNALIRFGRVLKSRRLWWLVIFLVLLFLFFSNFDWQTSRYGVFAGVEIDMTTDLGALLKTVGEMIVLIMIFAESFIQVLNRLVSMMGASNVFLISNKTIRAWMLVGYGILITLLLSNYWYSYVAVEELYGPVIGICLSLLPTVFQVILFEVVLGYIFASLED